MPDRTVADFYIRYPDEVYLQLEQGAADDEERRGGSSGAMLALIEGDANRVEESYLKGLGPSTAKQYDREQRAQGTDFGKATVDVPPFVELLFSAPYELGPLTIRMLVADGREPGGERGPHGADADLGRLRAGRPHRAAAAEPCRADLAAGERRRRAPGEAFGAFELYVMLATRGRPGAALSAADAVLGGRAQGLRRNGKYCYRATLATARRRRGDVRRECPAAVGDQGDGRVGQPRRKQRHVHGVRSGRQSGRGFEGPPRRRRVAVGRSLRDRGRRRPKAACRPRPPAASPDCSRSVPARSPRCSEPAADRFRPTRAQRVRDAGAATGADVSRQSESGIALNVRAERRGPATRRRRWSTTQISRASIRTT